MVTGAQTLVDHIQIKIGGSPLAAEKVRHLHKADVDTTLGLPDMAEIHFTDNPLALVDDSAFDLGKEVEILTKGDTTSYSTIFKGEITSIEPEYSEKLGAMFIIRAMDKTHRLTRATKTRVFVNTKDSDIVSSIGGEYGLTVAADATTTVYKHVFQENQNDFDFLHNLAERNGFFLYSKLGALQFKKALPTSSAVTLKWGTNLRSFHPRITVAGQVNKVTVKGWDVQTKAPVVGVASSSKSQSTTGFGSWGGGLAQTKISEAERFEVRRAAASQADAEKMAQGILDDINASSVEGDGLAFGNPAISAGILVTVEDVGTRFGGKYWITAARHSYTHEDGYMTYFTIGGRRGSTLADVGSQSGSNDNVGRGHLWAGVVPAIVTNNLDTTDNTNMGYVKIKFPWLDDAKESHWARLASPGAGKQRGMVWMPEVNDEVLVAFEAGDFNRPYIIGGLWNGKDALPQNQNVLVVDGKVEVRTFQTRIGHILRFTDKDGQEKIELLDGKDKTSFVMDTANEKITMTSSKDIEIHAKTTGKIDITADGGPINIKAGADVKVDGVNVNVTASASMALKAATMNIEASGPVTIKGAVVKIN